MNDSLQNLIEVRRSSGQKEWMTKEKLEALNQQRALKREKLNKPASRSTPKKINKDFDWAQCALARCFTLDSVLSVNRFKLLSQAARQRHRDTEKSFKAALIPL